MKILLCFDFLGILFSFLGYLFLLLGFPLPNSTMAVVLNIGLFTTIGTRLFITKDLRQGKGWFFDKSLKGVYPHWLKKVTALIIIYGAVNSIFYLGGFISMLRRFLSTPAKKIPAEEAAIAIEKLFLGYFSAIMICYAVEFLVLYTYKILKETKLQKLISQGTIG